MKSVFTHRFIASGEAQGQGNTTILGCPLDATSSFRGGTKFAPDSIRKASWTLETYSPYLKLDLEEMTFEDAGNLELPQGDLAASLDLIKDTVEELAGRGKFLLFGGEHLLTYPVVKAVKNRIGGRLAIVHFDAHCDLRDDYEGQKLSHATVMKRVKELGGIEMLQIGIRSGTKKEFTELSPVDSPEQLAARIDRNVPIYLTFDMDALDPSLVPGVTTPEPGGLNFREAMAYFSVLKGLDIVGADIVELAPDYDATFVSSVTAAKVAREVLMLLAP
jgi:agmatinase